MIIRQTTTIVFEYPQDYLQEQEWCKTKEDRWIHKSTDTLGAVYENTISYSIGQPSNSEKPNNCETCKHYKLACDLFSEICKYEPKDEPTISKMEQVETEPQTEPLHTCSVNGRPYSERSSCEHFKCTADEPQTDCPWK